MHAPRRGVLIRRWETMAKRKKGARDYVSLECPECKNRNYRTSKQLRGTPKLELRKYCSTCRQHVQHKERKK